MNVEYLALIVFYEPRAKSAHEAGKYDQVRFVLVECHGNGSIELLALLEFAMFHADSGDTRLQSPLESVRIMTIRKHDGDFEGETAVADLIDE